MLEEYCLGRAPDPLLWRVEDHLLVCAECCARVADLDVYLDLMKAGLAEREELQSVEPLADKSAVLAPTTRV